MDLETLFRELIRRDLPFKAQIGLNQEGRVLLRIEAGTAVSAGYVIVENAAIEADVAPPGTKPPPQSVGVQGFDAHKGMGDRT